MSLSWARIGQPVPWPWELNLVLLLCCFFWSTILGKMVSPSPNMNWTNCNHQETLTSCLWVVLKPKKKDFGCNFCKFWPMNVPGIPPTTTMNKKIDFFPKADTVNYCLVTNSLKVPYQNNQLGCWLALLRLFGSLGSWNWTWHNGFFWSNNPGKK